MRIHSSSLVLTGLLLSVSSLACGGSPPMEDASSDAPDLGVSRAALSPLIVEAESAIGPGVVESDATASGGQLRAFTTVYDAATASFTTNGTLQSGTVRVRTAQCSTSQWAQVLVDGVIVLTEQVMTTGAWIDLPLDVAGLPAGNHTVTFKYRMGSNGCAFRYDQATFSVNDPPPSPPPPPTPIVVEAESATGAGVVEADPTASNGQRRTFLAMYDTAQAALNTTATTTSVTVRAYGALCTTPPRVSLLVDGKSVLMKDVPQTAWTDHSANVSIPPGAHTVAFQYRSSGGGRGCVLRVDKATFAFD